MVSTRMPWRDKEVEGETVFAELIGRDRAEQSLRKVLRAEEQMSESEGPKKMKSSRI